MQHRDHRLREGLDRRTNISQRRRDRRSAELGEVRAGHEASPGADQHGAADLRVVRNGLGGPHKACPHGLSGRVDRWIVDRDDCNVTLTSEPDDIPGHARPAALRPI